ncbi:hypothetical protein G9396_15455 [Providencia rettgeri]|nr:hypothetical protein G9396_15455 [Providencia rettgeri]
MNRDGAIDLLNEVKEILENMKQSNDIKPVKIKASLEHLRSALEYVTNDTFDSVSPTRRTNRDNIYFPYGKRQFINDFFEKKLRLINFQSTRLYLLFNSIQDYTSDNDGLVMMCKLTNQIKHQKPANLNKEEVVTGASFSAAGFPIAKVEGIGSSLSIGKIVLNGEEYQGFSYNKGVVNFSDRGLPINMVLTKDKKIKFHGTEYEVIPFIDKCLIKVEDFVHAVYDELEKLHI